jgi:hypothetical protein
MIPTKNADAQYIRMDETRESKSVQLPKATAFKRPRKLTTPIIAFNHPRNERRKEGNMYIYALKYPSSYPSFLVI